MKMNNFAIGITLFFFLGLFSVSTVFAGGSPEDSGLAVHVADEGIAAQGADVVAYFSLEPGAPAVPGESIFSYTWKDATWLFATEENREKFIRNPEEYAPQYGGYCAWAIARDKLATIDPDRWDIVDGKLYLNYNEKTQNEWRENQSGDITKGDTYWQAKQAELIQGS